MVDFAAAVPSELGPPGTRLLTCFQRRSFAISFAPTVAGMEEPELFVSTLEEGGWRAAWIRGIWNHPCAAAVVLDSWAAAVEFAEPNGGTDEFIEAVFHNTVTKPCGPEVWFRLVRVDQDAVLIDSPGPHAVIVEGVVRNDNNEIELLRGDAIAQGQVIIEGFIENQGSEYATLLLVENVTLTIAAGETVVVARKNTSTYSTCRNKCSVLIHGGMYVVIDPKCFCKCWACAQGDTTWIGNLPDCEFLLTLDGDGNPINPDPGVWENPEEPVCCHPGTKWCIRSCPAVDGDPGQQCCYDFAGKLLTEGEGAGTPDIVAPCGLWDKWHHWEEDVAPYTRCKRAGMLECYLKHRPPNNGNDCVCHPPGHVNCSVFPIPDTADPCGECE